MGSKKRGLALLGVALILTTTSALAQQDVRVEAVIVSHTDNNYSVRVRGGATLNVVVGPTTTVREDRGGLSSDRTRDAQSLIPGLIIRVDGDQSGDTITAERIEFRERDWRAAVASRAGTIDEFARQSAQIGELRQAIIDGQEYVIREEATVLFASGSVVISPQYQQQLRALAQHAPSFGNYRISVLGFADPVGNAEANERLSQRRAAAVRNYLSQTGLIQPGRVLGAAAMGEGTIAPGEMAPTTNAEMRRVLVRVVTPKTQLTQ
jgi:outer membrane protein OmpA-like peptidoglycan-associated protein